jgi:hypothetical protein
MIMNGKIIVLYDLTEQVGGVYVIILRSNKFRVSEEFDGCRVDGAGRRGPARVEVQDREG